MDWYWLILLLPIASYSGYALGRRGIERRDGERVEQLSKQYFEGLNHLLNDQPDQAIALFERIADNDNDRFETQLALGNLFRRRGELDRAMKLHQDLSVRPMLSTEQRAMALLELGEDFVRAGLLDRAEALFDELLQIDAQSAPALKHLIAIYEQEREWQKAIDAAARYQALTDQSMAKSMGHFACELALIAHKATPQKSFAATANLKHDRHEYLQQALQLDPDSVRAQLMLAEHALLNQDSPAACRAIEKVLDGDAHFVVDLLPLIKTLGAIDQPAAAALFQRAVELDRGSSALIAYAQFLAPSDRPAAAEMLRKRAELKPSVRVLQEWLSLDQQHEMAEPLRSIVEDGLKQVIASPLTHRCSVCGFGARQLHWNCPSCKSWGSVKPLVLP
jgi:lipopolysaccharide assembly protein B